MKINIPLIVLALAFTGCSRHSPTASLPKNNDLGIVEVSSGKPRGYALADGRACTITPTVLPGGDVSLSTKIDETNGATKTLVFQAPADGRSYTFALDGSTVITATLRK